MTATNQQQISDWNGPVGERWLTYNDWLDERTAAYGQAALAAAAPQAGEAVLDIGCGAGATSFELARAVGSGGRVVGVDVSEPLVGRARERGQALGLPVEFRLADASRPLFAPHSFDLLYSRYSFCSTASVNNSSLVIRFGLGFSMNGRLSDLSSSDRNTRSIPLTDTAYGPSCSKGIVVVNTSIGMNFRCSV